MENFPLPFKSSGYSSDDKPPIIATRSQNVCGAEEEPRLEELVRPSRRSSKRTPKKCPKCHKLISYLSKHLETHGLTKSEIRHLCYVKRKRKAAVNKGRSTRVCPIGDCINMEGHLRLDLHLQRKHKLTPEDSLYNKLIRPKKRAFTSTNPEQSTESNSAENSNVLSTYLQSLDAGVLSKQNTIHQGHTVKQILDGIKLSTLEDITSEETKLALQNWFIEYSANNEHSSAVTYIAVFINFLANLIRHTKDLQYKSELETLVQRLNK